MAIRAHEQFSDLFGLVVNLLSPILLGLVVSEMKKSATVLLLRQPNERVSSFPRKFYFLSLLFQLAHMDAVDFTMVKLVFASIALIPFVYIFERKNQFQFPDC